MQSTANLAADPLQWIDLTNFVASATNFIFLDQAAANDPTRFYRVSPPDHRDWKVLS